jgi:hypothetical protein
MDGETTEFSSIDNDLMNMLSKLNSRFRRGQYFTNIGQFSISKLKHYDRNDDDPLLEGKLLLLIIKCTLLISNHETN